MLQLLVKQKKKVSGSAFFLETKEVLNCIADPFVCLLGGQGLHSYARPLLPSQPVCVLSGHLQELRAASAPSSMLLSRVEIGNVWITVASVGGST